MNKEQFSSKWGQIKGLIKQKFNKLTDSDITEVNGKLDVLIGKIQARYGFPREKAEQELSSYLSSVSSSPAAEGAQVKGVPGSQQGQGNRGAVRK